MQSSMAMPGNYNSVQRGTGYGYETYGNYTRSYNMPPPSPSYNRRTNDYEDYTHIGAHIQIAGTQMIAELEVAKLINLSTQLIIGILGIGTIRMRTRMVIIR